MIFTASKKKIEIKKKKKPTNRFFQSFSRVATRILKSSVSDQTARPVWQLVNPCRSVRRRTDSTPPKKTPNRTQQCPLGSGERWKPKETFLERSSHFLFCCSNPAARLIVLLLSGNKSSTGLWSFREAHVSRGRAHTHTYTRKRTPTR